MRMIRGPLPVLSLAGILAMSALHAPTASAQWHASARAPDLAALAPAYGEWRQQLRVATPVRNARWRSPPPGAVRVYHRRFDTRWNWRPAPDYRVVYTYSRGELWFLDPTTGWAFSVDRYGIVYTADPWRGWVYSLGPLTRWTADLLYFFDLYRFDRGYWYCRDYDYFVDHWERYPRRGGYYTYDTAYTTLWDWEPYWGSRSFVSFSTRFTTVWVTQVRSHYTYIERNPNYRREMLENIGLPAVSAAPPRYVSPRAVATDAYWEARDLAAAGLSRPQGGRGRDLGLPQSYSAGTFVDTQRSPVAVVEPGAPVPGFNAPFPDGSYGFGVQPGTPAGRGRDAGGGLPQGQSPQVPAGSPYAEPRAEPAPQVYGRGRDDGGLGRQAQPVPRYEEPMAPGYEAPEAPRSGRGRDDGGIGRLVDPGPRQEQPRQQPRYQEPEQPRFQAPAQPRYEAPAGESFGRGRDDGIGRQVQSQPRYEAPREQPRFEAPREEPRFQPREEPRFEPREEPRFERREEPRYEAPARSDHAESEPHSSSRGGLRGLGVREDE